MKRYIKEHKEEIGEELCDVLFWVLLISNDFNIQLADAFQKKMKKNEKKYPIKSK